MKPLKNSPARLRVAARSSKLSRAQVEEVLQELLAQRIEISFDPIWIQSSGDLDRTTSLKAVEKSDFFTKEVDDLLLTGHADIAIHSAKDLPSPLHEDLHIIGLTLGKDPSDSLVMEEGYTIATLPKGARIGTSSLRREENLKAIREDFCFVDIRGTIEERLDLFYQKKIDALVVAEAALLRLGYHDLYRETIACPVAEHQGKLAVVARKENALLEKLFQAIDSRVRC